MKNAKIDNRPVYGPRPCVWKEPSFDTCPHCGRDVVRCLPWLGRAYEECPHCGKDISKEKK